MDNIWGFIGIMVFGSGIFALYSYVKMKSSGEINANLLLGKEFMYKTCKDKEAYIQKAGPALLVFGIAGVIYGGIDIVHCYVYPMAAIDITGMVLFFIVLVWFGLYTTKLKKNYF